MIRPQSMNNKVLGEEQILETWMPRVKAMTGIEESDATAEKLRWMSIYAHNHQLAQSRIYENANATLGNIPGMGSVNLPGNPTTQTGFSGQTSGSGDKPMSLMPLSMQVAGQTVGLDLLPVVPMGGPMGFLNYVDYVYAGGRGLGNDLNVTAVPFLIQVPVTLNTLSAATPAAIRLNPATPPTVLIKSAGTSNFIRARLIATSRINGYTIFAVEGIYNASSALLTSPENEDPTAPTIFSILDGTSDITFEDIDPGTFGGTLTINGSHTESGGLVAEYVKALENVVKGFTADSEASWTKVTPYERGKGETKHSKSMGVKFFNKSVSAKTLKVDVAVTREQIQDSRQFGFDIISQINAVLANELSQAINANVLDRIFALGATNHVNIAQREDVDFHVNLGSSALAFTAIDSAFAAYDNTGQAGETITFDGKLSYANVPAVAVTGGETLYSVNRRLYGQLLATKNIINTRGRRGPADSIIANGNVMSVLQDVAGFQAAPMVNSVNQQTVYNSGSLAGMQLYTDPQMAWGDTRVSCFRKGDGATAGLVFMPYLMAESVDTIAEDSMAPKIQVMSRYDIVEAGFYPEAYYMTLYVGSDTNNLVR